MKANLAAILCLAAAPALAQPDFSKVEVEKVAEGVYMLTGAGNTHWHGDHVSGNENTGKAGALLVAHENVRRRTSAGQLLAAFGRKVEPSPEAALPVVTFTDAVTFNGGYPFIDTSSGGRVDGVIAAAERVLAGCSERTRIIPGHGPVATKADLQAYRDVVKTLRGRIAKLKAEGKTRDEVVAAKPTADQDVKWGGGFMKGDTFTGLAYDSLP